MKKLLLLLLFIVSINLPSAVYGQSYNESKDFSYALKLYNENFFDVAAQQFDAFINRYPSSDRIPDARFYHGTALMEGKDYAAARIAFQTLAVTFPDHQRAAEAWFKVGEAYRAMDKSEDAAKAFETVKILYPSSSFAPEALINAAALFTELRQFIKAEQVCRDFLDRYPESSEYLRGRLLFGEVLLAKGELEKADVEFQRVLEVAEKDSDRSAATLGRARVYQQLGLFQQAAANYRNVIRQVPGSDVAFQALVSLSNALLERSEWSTALQLLEKESAAFDKDQRLQLTPLQIQALFRSESYVQARDKAEQLLPALPENDPNKSVVQYYLACAAKEQGLASKALENFKLLTDPAATNVPEAYQIAATYSLADLYLQQNDIAAARLQLNRYQTQVAANPNGENLHQRLIRAAMRSNQLAVGVDELQRFRGRYPQSVYRDDLIFESGKAYFSNNQYERSLIAFEQVRDQYPGSLFADSSRVFIDFINTYYRENQKDGVSRMAGLMGKMLTGSERRELLFDLGKIYLNDLQEYRQAIKIFEKYVETAEDSAGKGAGYHYLARSRWLLAEFDAFSGNVNNNSQSEANAAIRQAMNFVRFSPAPDSLTYLFLTTALPNDIRGTERESRLWQLFLKNHAASQLIPEAQLAFAGLQQKQGQNGGAIQLLEQLMQNKSRPDIAGEAAWRCAQILQANGQPEQAEECLKNLLLNFPQHPRNVEAHWWLADRAAKARAYQTAAAFLERLVSNYNYANRLPEARARLTDYLIASGQTDQAVAYINPGESDDAAFGDAVIRYYLPITAESHVFYAGKVAFTKKNYADARAHLLRYLNSGKDGKLINEAFYLMGQIALEKPDKQAALLHFSLVNADYEKEYYYRATETAGNLLFEDHQYAEAMDKMKALLPLDTDPARKMQHEAIKIRSQIHLGQTQAAAAGIKEFDSQFSKLEGVKDHLAAFEWEQGRVKLANKQFDAAISNFKRVTGKYKSTSFADNAQLSIARTYATLNKSKEALKETEEFFKKYPNSELTGDAYLLNAEVYFRNERMEEGMAAINAAVSAAKTPSARKRALGMQIIAYRNGGAWDNALQATRSYINEFPEADDLITQKINLGIALTNLGRTTEATEYLRKLKFEVDSEVEPEIQYYIGEALYNGGQYDDAINEFLKIPLLSRKTKLQWEASALYKAGQAYERLGRKSDAIRMYQEIIDRPGIQAQLKSEARKLIAALKTG